MLNVRFRRSAPGSSLPLVVPVLDGASVPEEFAAAAEAAHFVAECGRILEVAAAPRRALVGLGRFPIHLALERAGGAAAAAFLGEPHLLLDARALSPVLAACLASGAAMRAWRFDRHRRGESEPFLSMLTVLCEDPAAAREAFAPRLAGVRGMHYARDLVAEPANHLSTRSFAERLEGLADYGIRVEVLGHRRLAREGFGALLAVGRAAATPPRLAVLRWRGSFAAPPVALVGKGVVFDTGGLSIKPAANMHEMRADMAGAAACAGAMLALALRNSPAPAVAVLALAENATGAESYRPGDVLTTLSGRTVEVVDTDAEGRLVLADALHYAARFRPRAAITVATLTGAIVSALGRHRAGLFGNDASLAAALAAAGEAVGERLWEMPIGTQHRADLASDIADIRQCVASARGEGGWAARFIPDACHAAAFLSEFAGDMAWGHLDIAGVDSAEAPYPLGPAGPTGFGARLLDALVAARFEQADQHAPVPRRG
jgi:leucyl aminopeptidase